MAVSKVWVGRVVLSAWRTMGHAVVPMLETLVSCFEAPVKVVCRRVSSLLPAGKARACCKSRAGQVLTACDLRLPSIYAQIRLSHCGDDAKPADVAVGLMDS